MTSVNSSTKHKSLATLHQNVAEARAWLAPFSALLVRWQYCFDRAQFLACQSQSSATEGESDHNPYALAELKGLLADLDHQAAELPALAREPRPDATLRSTTAGTAPSLLAPLASLAQFDLALCAFRIKASCLMQPREIPVVHPQYSPGAAAIPEKPKRPKKPIQLVTIIPSVENSPLSSSLKQDSASPKDQANPFQNQPESGRLWALSHFRRQQDIVAQCHAAIDKAEQFALIFAENLNATQASLISDPGCFLSSNQSGRKFGHRIAKRLAEQKVESARLHNSLDRADDRVFWLN